MFTPRDMFPKALPPITSLNNRKAKLCGRKQIKDFETQCTFQIGIKLTHMNNKSFADGNCSRCFN